MRASKQSESYSNEESATVVVYEDLNHHRLVISDLYVVVDAVPSYNPEHGWVSRKSVGIITFIYFTPVHTLFTLAIAIFSKPAKTI